MIIAVAFNTFRETIRDRVLLNIFFFSLAMVLISIILSRWSIGQERKILIDFGLSVVSIFGLLVSIFIGIGLVHREIERRTIFTILSKPVRRSQFVVGKFLGMAATLCILIILMGSVLYGIVTLQGGAPRGIIIISYILIYWEMLIMVSVALTFSCVTTPMISAVMSIFLYTIGHLSSDIHLIGSGGHSPSMAIILKILYYILPNLERFNIAAEVVHGLPLAGGSVIVSMLYGTVYIAFLLLLSSTLLERREFQ